MIWANVTKFGQNFIAPQNFLGWYGNEQSPYVNVPFILLTSGKKFCCLMCKGLYSYCESKVDVGSVAQR